MGETLTVKTPAERMQVVERLLSQVDAAVVIVGLTLLFSGLDFWSHPHGGVADPERRRLLAELIGPIAKHIGNFGFTAAASITAVFVKHMGDFLTLSEKGRKLARKAGFTIATGILILNALAEVYPKNTEMLGDLSMAGLAFFLSTLATELAMSKFNRAKST